MNKNTVLEAMRIEEWNKHNERDWKGEWEGEGEGEENHVGCGKEDGVGKGGAWNNIYFLLIRNYQNKMMIPKFYYFFVKAKITVKLFFLVFFFFFIYYDFFMTFVMNLPFDAPR